MKINEFVEDTFSIVTFVYSINIEVPLVLSGITFIYILFEDKLSLRLEK